MQMTPLPDGMNWLRRIYAGYEAQLGALLQELNVVVTTHTLHAFGDLSAALDNVRRLLTRDGLLLSLERSPERHADIIFGRAHNRDITVTDRHIPAE